MAAARSSVWPQRFYVALTIVTVWPWVLVVVVFANFYLSGRTELEAVRVLDTMALGLLPLTAAVTAWWSD